MNTKLNEMKQHIGCSKCVLSNTYEFANVNEDGECKFCQGFEHQTFLGKEQLINDLALQDGEKLGITVSGGKDSIYMWGYLTELLGSDRICAFTYYRPGVSSEVALENVMKTQKILGTELVIHTDTSAYERFQRNFEILLKNPQPEAVRVLLCAGCRYGITGKLYEEGIKKNIYKYMSGSSYLELAPFKEELMAARSIHHDIDEGFEAILKDYPELDYDNNLEIIRRDQKYKYKNNDTMRNQIPVQDQVQLFDFDLYFENDPETMEDVVIEKYDWKKTNRSWHFDCIVEDIKDVFYYGSLGYTESDFKIAAMVRHGLLTREQGLEKLQNEHEQLANSYTKMLETLREHKLEHMQPYLETFYKQSKYLNYK